MKRIAVSLLAVGLLAAPVLAAETAPAATAPAAPATKAADANRKKAPDSAQVAAALVLASPGRAPACRDFAQAPGARWRLVSRHGVDWLVTPCGDLFFSVGLNTLDGGAPAPEVGGRTAYYWGSFYPSLDAWSAT